MRCNDFLHVGRWRCWRYGDIVVVMLLSLSLTKCDTNREKNLETTRRNRAQLLFIFFYSLAAGWLASCLDGWCLVVSFGCVRWNVESFNVKGNANVHNSNRSKWITNELTTTAAKRQQTWGMTEGFWQRETNLSLIFFRLLARSDPVVNCSSHLPEMQEMPSSIHTQPLKRYVQWETLRVSACDGMHSVAALEKKTATTKTAGTGNYEPTHTK